MFRRLFDIIFSLLVLSIFLPILSLLTIIIFLEDFKNPLYISIRFGKNLKPFRLFKLRSMAIGADKCGPIEVQLGDKRVTKIGWFIRKFKLDEYPQFFNVFLGHMTVVGPRPKVKNHINVSDSQEVKIASVKPGITDISSIVFSNQEYILKNSKNNASDYFEKFIKPNKNLLAIYYIDSKNILLDLMVIAFTILIPINRKFVLKQIYKHLYKKEISKELLQFIKKQCY